MSELNKPNQFEKQTFDTEVGQKVEVQREDLSNETAARTNRMLLEAGDLIKNTLASGKHLEHVGSMSVHIFQSHALGQIFFATQTTTLGQTNEMTASLSLEQLRKDAMKHYGRKLDKKRSGF